LSRWDAEIARRVVDMDFGRAQFMPTDEALAGLWQHMTAVAPDRRQVGLWSGQR